MRRGLSPRSGLSFTEKVENALPSLLEVTTKSGVF